MPQVTVSWNRETGQIQTRIQGMTQIEAEGVVAIGMHTVRAQLTKTMSAEIGSPDKDSPVAPIGTSSPAFISRKIA
jgi:hypothetical protein